MQNLEIGTYGSPQLLTLPYDDRKKLIEQAEAAGLDHLFVGDHVSFHNGFGMDGLIDAATLAAMSCKLKVYVGVYLLALRHPVTVARQLSSLSRSAPGRVAIGVGLGGEDRHEMAICGTDPSTRGKQTNHAMQALRQLLSGQSTTYHCDFFSFEDAIIQPPPSPQIPLMVGGRSDAAIERTALYGDGWLGLWCSPKRFGQVVQQVKTLADEGERTAHNFQHGLQIWVGFGEQKNARQYVAKQMQEMYQMPFEPFEKYSPYGSPQDVAEFLAPYVEQGAQLFNVTPCGESFAHEIECVAEVNTLLKKEFSTVG